MTKQKALEDMNYEEAFSELEGIIGLLETGEHPLEETLEAYGRGQLLLKRCSELLEKAELKVRLLTEEREGEAEV